MVIYTSHLKHTFYVLLINYKTHVRVLYSNEHIKLEISTFQKKRGLVKRQARLPQSLDQLVSFLFF